MIQLGNDTFENHNLYSVPATLTLTTDLPSEPAEHKVLVRVELTQLADGEDRRIHVQVCDDGQTKWIDDFYVDVGDSDIDDYTYFQLGPYVVDASDGLKILLRSDNSNDTSADGEAILFSDDFEFYQAFRVADAEALANSPVDRIKGIQASAEAAFDARLTVRKNTAQAGGASTITLDAGASATNDWYINQRIYLNSGTGAGQSRKIVSYVGATKVATVDSNEWATNPDNTTGFIIAADYILTGTGATAQQVWEYATRTFSAGGLQQFSRIVHGRTTWYVDEDQANDDGGGTTWDTAKKTFAAAHALLTDHGQRIELAEGDYTGADVSNADYLEIVGIGDGTQISSTGTVLTVATGFRASRLHLNSTGGNALTGNGATDIQLENCTFTATGNIAVDLYNSARVSLKDCRFIGGKVWGFEWNAANIYDTCVLENCLIKVSGLSGFGDAGGVYAAGGRLIVRNANIYVTSDVDDATKYVLGGRPAGADDILILENCHIHCEATGNTIAAGLRCTAGTVIMRGGSIETSGTTAYDLVRSGGILAVDSEVKFDASKVLGDVILFDADAKRDWPDAIEPGLTERKLFQRLGGKLSGKTIIGDIADDGTRQETFKGMGVETVREVDTVDQDGGRSAVEFDP